MVLDEQARCWGEAASREHTTQGCRSAQVRELLMLQAWSQQRGNRAAQPCVREPAAWSVMTVTVNS